MMDALPTAELFNFDKKIVLITGGASGIGAGIVRRFSEAGADVIFSYHSHEEKARQLVDEIQQRGKKALAIQANVADPDQVRSLFEQIGTTWGPVDVLINNAGIFPEASLLTMTVDEWDETLDVNLRGVFLCTQAAARSMIAAKKGGSIVNIGSIEGMNPAVGHCHYSASKAGVAMFGMNAAVELGPYEIRVNTVCPGLINSPGLPKNWPEGVARWMSRAPLGRLGEPVDIADACLFFASDASRWITGAQLVVDGGVLTCQAY